LSAASTRFASGKIHTRTPRRLDLIDVCPLLHFNLPFNMISRAGLSVVRQGRTQLRPRTGPSPVASLSVLARLLSSLAVVEQRDGKLNHGSLGAVTAAQKLGGSITAFVAGGNIKAVAEEVAKVNGIEKIIAVDNGAYDKAGT
jgi:electron transfer flavoprotein alpha subunit